MNIKQNKSGFTLLEIIIVVIIVGVLASLALPRFFSTVEFSRGQEALGAMAAVRGGLERCYVSKGATDYTGCTITNIDTGDPLAGAPNAHFSLAVSGQGTAGYTITAVRNTVDGGLVASNIVITQTGTTVTRSGATAFKGIN